jgi:glycosyltransferase involved in cell wall biosynthesis
MNVLHILPRFMGGGPERHLLALIAAWRAAGHRSEHAVAVLDAPVSAPLLIRARRLGIRMLVKPDRQAVHAAIDTADLVEVTYWNHPRLLEFLREEMPSARVLIECAVAGNAPPHVLFAELGTFAEAMVMTSPVSRGTPAVHEAASRARPIAYVPALADMSRLTGFQPRAHTGIRVGYLGLVEPTKMHPRFAELSAAVRTRDVHFDVFGDGSWGLELARRFSALGAGERVDFHGHAEDLREALAGIDIFGYPLAPDTYATSEKAIQEAMWAGIPPVVLSGSGAADLVEHERTGLVCESEDEYPRAIERLAEDSELRRRLGDAARDFAHEHFDPARNAERLRTIFERAATLPRRNRDPLPGADETAAYRFVRSLGDMAGPFATSVNSGANDALAVRSAGAVADAQAAIARSSAVLARGEGGVIHYRNTYPEDAHLRLWAGLIARHAGDAATAAAEFAAAAAFGLAPAAP